MRGLVAAMLVLCLGLSWNLRAGDKKADDDVLDRDAAEDLRDREDGDAADEERDDEEKPA